MWGDETDCQFEDYLDDMEDDLVCADRMNPHLRRMITILAMLAAMRIGVLFARAVFNA